MNYNKDLLELLNSLSNISNIFGVEKVEDENIKIKYKGDYIGFILKAPDEYLQYPGNFLGFMDYGRFMSYFRVFDIPNKDEKLSDTPQLSYNLTSDDEPGEIVISSSRGKQKFTYRTGTRRSIRAESFESAKLPTIDATMILSESQNAHLHKIINQIKPDLITFSFKESTCTVLLQNLVFEDSYEIEYKLENSIDDEFTFAVNADSIKLLPAGEYKLEICNRGFIKFIQIRDDKIDLQLCISKKKVR